MSVPRQTTPSRSDVDMAVGILMMLRRVGAESAHEDLLSTAVQHRVGLHSLSRALIALASGAKERSSLAADVAWARWGRTFPVAA